MNDSNNTGKTDLRNTNKPPMTPSQCYEYAELRLTEAERLHHEAYKVGAVDLTERAGHSIEFWTNQKNEYAKSALAERVENMNEVKKEWTRGSAIGLST